MTTIATLTLVSVSAVLFTNMVDDFLDDGMVFGFYGRFLKRNEGKTILKPLWGCIICTNIWILFAVYGLHHWAPGLVNFIFVVSFGHWLLKLLAKNDLL